MKKLVLAVVILLFGFLIVYANLPVINYGYWGLPFILMVLTIFWILGSKQIYFTVDTHNNNNLSVNSRKGKASLWFLLLLIVYMALVPMVTSWGLFRHQSYRNLIGTVEKGADFSNHIAPISIEKIRVVDEPLAYLLGDKVLGAQPALGSQVDLGEFTIQKVNDGLYWVAPLVHSGFFKWNKNKAGTAGYVMVNATNERDVKLVQEVNGAEIRVKYQPQAYFQTNLHRHLYFNGYMTSGLTDFTFEVDDAGMPFWVVTRFVKRIGFYGDDAASVIVVNAQSGEINEYSIEDAPSWIDRIQPSNFIENQLNDWGEYVKGYWNFANEEKLQITEGLTLVYGEDNKSYWYTGLTSVGADEATVGFVLVDTRTKQTVWYKQSGATEYAAQNSAIGKVQEKGYTASLPIPYNINNIPTYVMTLKDKGGLVKMYAMVAIEDYTIVGVGNSLQETLMAYKNAFNMTGSKFNPQSDSQKEVLSTVVRRINSDIKNGNSFYYLTVDGSNNIFIGSTQISNELPVTCVGDSVVISYDNDTDVLIGMSSFKNKSLGKKN
ncbi:MAG: hypothetical protein RBS81_09375 [Tenuifilaceae bacterium]|jgi:hypothetical protein|nr:hypothetical protein [Tenuifilaceae bacterium]